MSSQPTRPVPPSHQQPQNDPTARIERLLTEIRNHLNDLGSNVDTIRFWVTIWVVLAILQLAAISIIIYLAGRALP